MLTWQPTASLEHLKLRAEILKKIRNFFSDRHVLEVETPLLSHATVTDPHLQSFVTTYQINTHQKETLYLQTSPEFAMKRLLAAGSGAIFQISKAFRNYGESGRLHNPEFTLLEWYRPGFDHHTLMDEVETLLQSLLTLSPAQRLSYAALFQKYVGFDPHIASLEDIQSHAKKLRLHTTIEMDQEDRDTWLQLIMTHVIEPQLPTHQATFIYDFPVSQAALARICATQPTVAERFEVYVGNIELANGYHELTEIHEQQQRFQNDLRRRQQLGHPPVPLDYFFLSALQAGLPDCAGVALGIDRLILLATHANALKDVISFSIENT